MMVLDLYRVGQRDHLAIGEVVEITIRRRGRQLFEPAHHRWNRRAAERQPTELDRAVGEGGHHAGGVDAGDLDLMGIGQIGIEEGDAPLAVSGVAEPWMPALFRDGGGCRSLVI